MQMYVWSQAKVSWWQQAARSKVAGQALVGCRDAGCTGDLLTSNVAREHQK